MSNRQNVVKELQTELGMRRKVWRAIVDRKTGKAFFSLQSHQERYDTLNAALEFMEGMTDREFAEQTARNIGRKAIKEATQTTLF